MMPDKTFIQSSVGEKRSERNMKMKGFKNIFLTINDVSLRQILSIKFIPERCIFKNCNMKKVKSERLCTASSKLCMNSCIALWFNDVLLTKKFKELTYWAMKFGLLGV